MEGLPLSFFFYEIVVSAPEPRFWSCFSLKKKRPKQPSSCWLKEIWFEESFKMKRFAFSGEHKHCWLTAKQMSEMAETGKLMFFVMTFIKQSVKWGVGVCIDWWKFFLCRNQLYRLCIDCILAFCWAITNFSINHSIMHKTVLIGSLRRKVSIG